MFDELRNLIRPFVDVLAPPTCAMCSVAIPTGHFCDPCHAALTTDPFPTCPLCASSMGPHSAICLRCDGEKFAFSSASRLGPYADLLRDAVLRLKEQTGANLAHRLGQAWAVEHRERFESLMLQAIIPIPLHWSRSWKRGYNQSIELALGLGGVLGVPVWRGALVRIRATTMQSELNRAERRKNLTGAFRVRPRYNVRNMTILLIDDVLTTGATADVASQALREAGAAQVHVGVLAHR
jgi:ComF family protein